MKAFKATGDVVPLKRRNGPLDEYEQLIMLRYILNQPSTYLHELQKNLSDHFGITVSS